MNALAFDLSQPIACPGNLLDMMRYCLALDMDGDWTWEIANSDIRIAWGFAKTKEKALESLFEEYKHQYGADIRTTCECGGCSAGYRVFGAGHAYWCAISPHNLKVVGEDE